MWSVQRCYKQGNKLVEIEFCTRGCEERTLGPEAEESPLLEAVVREQLVKTQQDGKGLAGAVVICEWWRLAVALSWFVVTPFPIQTPSIVTH
jgi:hypothetical protein